MKSSFKILSLSALFLVACPAVAMNEEVLQPSINYNQTMPSIPAQTGKPAPTNFPIAATMQVRQITPIINPVTLPTKRKSDDEKTTNFKPVAPFFNKVYFEPDQIKKAFHDNLMQEEGKIWAAYYMVTSDALTDSWIARKYLQQLKKTDKTNIKGMLAAARQLNTRKEDILIVDRKNIEDNSSALQKLSDHGIQVLVRNKDRQPASSFQKMHLKFMVIFDEKNEKGKLLIRGSYNLTNQAPYNWEDIEITNNPTIIDRFMDQHVKIRDYCEDFTQLQRQTPKPSTPIGEDQGAVNGIKP